MQGNGSGISGGMGSGDRTAILRGVREHGFRNCLVIGSEHNQRTSDLKIIYNAVNCRARGTIWLPRKTAKGRKRSEL